MGASLGSLASLLVAKWRVAYRSHSHLLQYLYRKERHWFLYFPLIIFLFGVWGIVPDLLHAFNILPKDVTRSAVFDVFYFHSTFEKLENENPALDQLLNWAGEAILLVVALSIFVYYVTQVRRAVRMHRHNNE